MLKGHSVRATIFEIWVCLKIIWVDSFSILFNHRSFQKPDPFSTRVSGGFVERFGSLERMEMEGTSRKMGGFLLASL